MTHGPWGPTEPHRYECIKISRAELSRHQFPVSNKIYKYRIESVAKRISTFSRTLIVSVQSTDERGGRHTSGDVNNLSYVGQVRKAETN